VKDPQMDTIDQLRAMVKELQAKLEYRTNLLAYLLPHVEYKAGPSNQSEYDYVCFEFMEKFSKQIEQFKDEYGKEISAFNSNKDGKL
jgi:hypothetical protein